MDTKIIKGKITPDPKEVFANWGAHVKEYRRKYGDKK
jgi:hypothetical protein